MDADTKRLYERINFEMQHVNTPPRFVYAREQGSRAPYRFRVPLGDKRYEHRLIRNLESRGLNPRIWSPVPKPEPKSSAWLHVLDVLMDVVCFFLSGCRPN